MSAPTLWISWRPAGTERWHRHDLFGHWTEAMARAHFRVAVEHGTWEDGRP